jgi:hypothetical protein
MGSAGCIRNTLTETEYEVKQEVLGRNNQVGLGWVNCCWPSKGQSFLVLDTAELMAIFSVS